MFYYFTCLSRGISLYQPRSKMYWITSLEIQWHGVIARVSKYKKFGTFRHQSQYTLHLIWQIVCLQLQKYEYGNWRRFYTSYPCRNFGVSCNVLQFTGRCYIIKVHRVIERVWSFWKRYCKNTFVQLELKKTFIFN